MRTPFHDTNQVLLPKVIFYIYYRFVTITNILYMDFSTIVLYQIVNNTNISNYMSFGWIITRYYNYWLFCVLLFNLKTKLVHRTFSCSECPVQESKVEMICTDRIFICCFLFLLLRDTMWYYEPISSLNDYGTMWFTMARRNVFHSGSKQTPKLPSFLFQ